MTHVSGGAGGSAGYPGAVSSSAPETKTPNGKKVQLQLTYGLNGKYKVTSVTNTIVVHPGQELDASWVQVVCDEYDNWEVTMVDNDIGAQVLSFIRGMIPVPAL